MCASWSVTPCVASSSSSTTLASAIACSVLTTENFSIASNTLPLAAQPGGVDQLELLPVALERHGDRVARRAGLVERDQPLLAEPGVDQRRLADVRPAGHGQADRRARRLPRRSASSSERAKCGQRRLECRLRRTMPCPCAAETGCGSPRPSSKNSASSGDSAMPSALLTASTTFLPARAQVARDVVVLPRHAGAHVDHEDHRVGLGDRLARLLGHLLDDAGRAVGLEAAGVDDDELVLADCGRRRSGGRASGRRSRRRSRRGSWSCG